jgi:hypothetical protein
MSETSGDTPSSENWEPIQGIPEYLALLPKRARDAALSIVALAGGRPIREFSQFVSKVSGVDITFTLAGINQSMRMGELSQAMDVSKATYIYSVNQYDVDAVVASEAEEIPVAADGRTIRRDALTDVVEMKIAADESAYELELALRGLRGRSEAEPHMAEV